MTPTRRLLLGGEPAIDFSVPDGLALVRLRVFVGVRFWRSALSRQGVDDFGRHPGDS